MPNWTENHLVAEGDKDELTRFLDTIGTKKNKLDFDKIIPMPAILRRTVSGARTISNVSVSTWMESDDGKGRLPTPEEAAELAQTGYENWYDWSCDNWGVKWSANDVKLDDSRDYGGYVELTFKTPWNAPKPIFHKLREMFPLLEFRFEWRHEDDNPYPHNLDEE